MAFIASLFSDALLHFRDRLVRVSWIRHEPPTLTIDEQVQLLEHRLPDEHFVTQNERFIERVSTLELEHEGLRDAHGFLTSVGILGHPLAASGKAEAKRRRGEARSCEPLRCPREQQPRRFGPPRASAVHAGPSPHRRRSSAWLSREPRPCRSALSILSVLSVQLWT